MKRSSLLPFLCILSLIRLDASSTDQPNFVVLFADDMGYGDLSCYGHPTTRTPNLDRMADEGARLTSFYCGAPVCSPSRAALLTGRYPIHAGMPRNTGPGSENHLPLDQVLIPQLLKPAGYNTMAVGKWHLGTEPEFLPRKQGFDHYYGMPCNFAHSPKFYDDDHEIFAETPLDRLTELYTQRVAAIIRESAKRKAPFFLYYAHNYPHTPFQAGEKFKGSSKDCVRGDIMQELDWGIGEMMKALKETGIADNTIVIFTSDHGDMFGDHGLMLKTAMHYRAVLEVPLFIAGPGITQGRSHSLVSTLDLAQTICALAGVEPFWGMQGHDLTPILREPAAQVRDHVLVEEDQLFDLAGIGQPLRMRTIVTRDTRLTRYAGSSSGEAD